MNYSNIISAIVALIISSSVIAATDTMMLAKLIGQSAAQLKELKEILEINNATFNEIEKANRKVQQTRYRILRTKYIIDSAKTLSNSNVESTQDALSYMRKAKSIGKNAKSLTEELNSLSEEEKQKLIEEIDKVNNEAKSIEFRIAERKVSLLSNKVNQDRVTKNQTQLKKYEALTEINEEISTGPLDPASAQVETAKNTSITNRILLQNSSLQTEQLKEMYRLNNLLEEQELERLKQRKDARQFWGMK